MSSSTVAAVLLNDPAYPRFKDHLIERTGLAYYLNQDEELAGRIADRLAALSLSQLDEYLDRLADPTVGEAELDALIAELTIGETYFFRHREQFEALRERVLPELIQQNQQHRRLRIWSAGCATGAEPYSIAILLKRELGHLLAGWDISIVGTDINREFLARAHRGEFADWAFRSSSEDLKEPCFSCAGKRWAIKPEFKQGVTFQYHNLVQHPFPSVLNNLSAFDLILCRNVMIYFQRDIVSRIIGQFHECLVDRGWLLVGHAECCVDFFRSFHTVNVPGAVLYQKGQTGPPCGDPFPTVMGGTERSGLSKGGMPAAQVVPTKLRSQNTEAKRRPTSRAAPKQPATKLTAVAERLPEIRATVDRAEWQQAARFCNELIAIDRLNPAAHFYHAIALEQMGQHVEAECALRRTIYLDRQFVLAHYHLGLLLQKRRDVAGSKRSFHNALRLLEQMDEKQVFSDADGLTVGALKQWTQSHLEVLCHA